MLKTQATKAKQALVGSAAVATATWVPLSSMSTDAMCERVRQIDGLDASMLDQYTTTIKKANVNGRVLSQCNLDELKKEMNMNFGDWQLFRAMVMEQRQAETQPVHDDSRAGSELGSSVGGPVEGPSRRPEGPPDAALGSEGAMRYSLNLSFEELSSVGLEEPQRHSNSHWTAPNHRASSMTSLNSQESSNDICKLTDKQQAEYRNAYQEYIAQMAQLEGLGSGAERPSPYLQAGAEDKAKEGEPEGRKAFPKGRSKVTDTCDGDAQLDPITEEDEKPDPSGASSSATAGARALLSRKAKGPGPRYHEVPSDEEESGAEEESDSTPLLSEERKRQEAEARPAESVRLLAKGKDYLSDVLLLDKKESSDSGLRSSGSSSDRSLQDADYEPGAEPEPERSDLMEMLEPEALLRKRGLPRNPSGLQESAVMRMSICSEAPSEGSALASSPEENWPATAVTNLNRSASSGTLNNNNSANSQHALHETAIDSPPIIISPGSTNTTTSITTTAVLHNENLRALQRKRSVPTDGYMDEERESIL